MGWSLDRRPTATLVKTALGMASRHLEAVLWEYLVHYSDVDGATRWTDEDIEVNSGTQGVSTGGQGTARQVLGEDKSSGGQPRAGAGPWTRNERSHIEFDHKAGPGQAP